MCNMSLYQLLPLICSIRDHGFWDYYTFIWERTEPFLVDEDCYSVICLFRDAKMFATGEGLSYEESQTLKGKVKLPDGSLFELRNDCDLLDLFKLLKDKGIDKFHVDIEVLPLAVEEPEKYIY